MTRGSLVLARSTLGGAGGVTIAGTPRIRAFWGWFATHHQGVKAAYSQGDVGWLDVNLTAQVKRIEPRLNWELGPYYHPDNTLVISPSVRENIELARRIVAAAPQLTGWHFLPAKPPKELNRLAMELPGSPGVEVCGDTWAYRLTAYNQMEFFDIEVFTDVEGPISDRDLELLTRRLIESLVGEVLYLERIGAVKVIRGAEACPAEQLTDFPLLGRHIAHLLSRG